MRADNFPPCTIDISNMESTTLERLKFASKNKDMGDCEFEPNERNVTFPDHATRKQLILKMICLQTDKARRAMYFNNLTIKELFRCNSMTDNSTSTNEMNYQDELGEEYHADVNNNEQEKKHDGDNFDFDEFEDWDEEEFVEENSTNNYHCPCEQSVESYKNRVQNVLEDVLEDTETCLKEIRLISPVVSSFLFESYKAAESQISQMQLPTISAKSKSFAASAVKKASSFKRIICFFTIILCLSAIIFTFGYYGSEKMWNWNWKREFFRYYKQIVWPWSPFKVLVMMDPPLLKSLIFDSDIIPIKQTRQ